MPKSKNRPNRRQFRPRDWQAESQTQEATAAAPRPAPSVPSGHRYQAPAKPAAAKPRVQIPRFGARGKLVAAGAAGGVVGGSGMYALNRHQQNRKAAMSKSYVNVNPFEEVVVFGKAYPLNVTSGTNVSVVRALVPTGGHVGHGLDLKVVRNRKGKGGRRSGLEHYSKAFSLPRIKGVKTAETTSAGVKRSLALVNNPKTGNVSRVAPQTFSAPTPRINGNIPSGNRRGASL